MDERLRRKAWGVTKAARSLVAPSGSSGPTALFILGCQRSGTTMVTETLDKDRRVKTYSEFSSVNRPADGRRPWSVRSTSRYGIRMKPLDEVAAKLERSRYPLVVLKPLVESQRAKAILHSTDRAVCLWVFRNYRDVARSNVELFTREASRINLDPMIRPEPGNWRSELVPDDVRQLIARHYSPAMSPFDGGALFWYARNRLFFDLDLASDERVMTLKYEDLASQPEPCVRRIYAHAGISFPGPRLVADIHPRSIGLGRELELSGEVESACEGLWAKLVSAYESRLERVGGARV
jgi:sulfotransferase family protein